MKARRFTIREANIEDVQRIWEWRHAGDAASYYKNTGVPTYADHQRWFTQAVNDNNKILLIVCRDNQPAVHVRFDIAPNHDDLAIVSIYVSPGYRGQAIAGPSLQLALDFAERKGIRRFSAQIHRDNRPSVRLFEKCGFVPAASDSQFMTYSLEIRTSNETGLF